MLDEVKKKNLVLSIKVSMQQIMMGYIWEKWPQLDPNKLHAICGSNASSLCDIMLDKPITDYVSAMITVSQNSIVRHLVDTELQK
jgi:hypothetical protein